MFTKDQLISLLRTAAENSGVAGYYFKTPEHTGLASVLKEAANMLEKSVIVDDSNDSKPKIQLDKCSTFLVDKPFRYLSRSFTQGDIVKVVGFRKSDGHIIISVNDETPIAGGNISDLNDIYEHDFMSALN